MKVLVIDDNQDNLISIKAVLSDHLPDVTVLTALNGEQGLDLAQAKDPDVILLDIVMPLIDGYEVCRRLKDDTILRSIPVLFLTALRTDRDSRIKAMKLGAEGFLSKPYDEIELCAQIQSMAKLKAATLRQLSEQQRLASLVEERTKDLQQSQTSLMNLLEELKIENSARKKSELALRDSEQNYRMLFAKMLNGFALFEIIWDEHSNPVDYQFLAVNPAFECMTGLKSDEVAKQTLKQVIPDMAAKWIATWHTAAVSGEPAFFPNFVSAPGKFSEVAAFRTVNNQFACVFADITERKHAAEALSLQLAELRRWQAVVVGREGRIGHLKREVNELSLRLGLEAPYSATDISHQESKP